MTIHPLSEYHTTGARADAVARHTAAAMSVGATHLARTEAKLDPILRRLAAEGHTVTFVGCSRRAGKSVYVFAVRMP